MKDVIQIKFHHRKEIIRTIQLQLKDCIFTHDMTIGYMKLLL